jgi:hypothetical protein
MCQPSLLAAMALVAALCLLAGTTLLLFSKL